MTACKQKVQESHSCLPRETGCLLWSSVHAEELGPNNGQGIDSLQKAREAGKDRGFLLLCPFYRLPPEGVIQIRAGFSHLKRFELKVYF